MINIRASDRAYAFHRRLKIGIDADWTKSNPERRAFHKQLRLGLSIAKVFRDRGFDHARLRVSEYDLTTVKPLPDSGMSLLDEIRTVVIECNKVGLTPIVAFQGEDFKASPTLTEIGRVKDWWTAVANRLLGLDCAFNILIETTLLGTTNTAILNECYKQCGDAIAAIDPSRVLIVCPQRISDPFELNTLVMPNTHCFAEAHFNAAGQSRTTAAKLWTTGTPAERKLITDKLDAMANWRVNTGYQCWVGAIMFCDYNSDGGNDTSCSYTIGEQINIANFILTELRNRSIPVAINSTGKYYDSSVPGWIADLSSLVDSFFAI